MTDTTDATTTSETAKAPGTIERARVERYNPTEIEPRWQKKWEELGLHRTDLHEEGRPPYYH